MTEVVVHADGFILGPPPGWLQRSTPMTEWIPFEEGEYWVEQAYLVTPDKLAIALENPVIEIAKAPRRGR